MRLAACAVTLISLAAVPAAGDIVLGLPIDCEIGHTCHIQHLVDHDPGPGRRDYTCGLLTYDGHKGTDFALPSLAAMQAGVNVLAAAPGTVTAVRDGMADVAYSPENAARIDGRECGNGIVVRHAEGWETQYCHLRNGSVQVSKGMQVDRGQVLAQVGLSGLTQFPHVHLSLRRNGDVIDPFAPAPDATCAAPSGNLWQVTPAAPPGALIRIGFAPAIPDYGAIKAGHAARDHLSPDAPGLVLFAYGYGGLTGDELLFEITGPDGPVLRQSAVLDRNQAQYFRASGKRLTSSRWPNGRYTGTVTILRNQTPLEQATVEMTVP